MPASPGAPARLLVASNEERNIGRQHLLLEPLPTGFRVHNRSRVPLPRGDGATIAADSSAEFAAPFSLLLPGRILLVRAADSVDEFGVQGLDQQTLGPADASDLSRSFLPPPALGASQVDNLVRWLQTTLGVLQSTVGSSDFLRRAAEALVLIVGLHSGRVLLRKQDQWTVAAQHGTATGSQPWKPSTHVLARVWAEKRSLLAAAAAGHRRRLGQPRQPPDRCSRPSECVLREEGVLVDYIGDEMMAMWGRPGAARPCRAPPRRAGHARLPYRS